MDILLGWDRVNSMVRSCIVESLLLLSTYKKNKDEEEEEENEPRGRGGWMVFLVLDSRKGVESLLMITWTDSAQGFQVEKPTPGLNVQRLPGDLLGDRPLKSPNWSLRCQEKEGI